MDACDGVNWFLMYACEGINCYLMGVCEDADWFLMRDINISTGLKHVHENVALIQNVDCKDVVLQVMLKVPPVFNGQLYRRRLIYNWFAVIYC
jgi:hypothetical protein